MRAVIIGAFGNFGARICRALEANRGIEVVASSRSAGVRLDIGSARFADALGKLSPDLVIHCAGPFQGQGYGVASAALAAGAHYLDLADGGGVGGKVRGDKRIPARGADKVGIFR